MRATFSFPPSFKIKEDVGCESKHELKNFGTPKLRKKTPPKQNNPQLPLKPKTQKIFNFSIA